MKTAPVLLSLVEIHELLHRIGERVHELESKLEVPREICWDIHRLAMVVPYLDTFDFSVSYWITDDGKVFSCDHDPNTLGIKAERISYGEKVLRRWDIPQVPFMQMPAPEMLNAESANLASELKELYTSILKPQVLSILEKYNGTKSTGN